MRVRRGGVPAPSVAPEGIIGSIDAPAEGAVVNRRLIVEGWAVPTGLVERVDIFVDDHFIDVAQIGGAPRNDVVRHFGDPTMLMSGYSLQLDLRDRPDGAEVTVRAEAAAGDARTVLGVRHVVLGSCEEVPDVAGVHGSVDAPVEGAVVDRYFVVEGWAVPTELLDRVDIFVDDHFIDVARIGGAPRVDVAGRFGDPTMVMSGYSLQLDLSDRPDGAEVTVRAEAAVGDARTVLGERHVVVGSSNAAVDDDTWTDELSTRADIAARRHAPGDGARLLVVAHSLRLGGAQLWLQEILEPLLRDRNVACTVVAPADGPLRRPLEAAGAHVHLLGPVPETRAAYESTVRELVLLAADDGCNMALVNTIGMSIGVDAAARCGIPAVLAVHEHCRLDEYWGDIL